MYLQRNEVLTVGWQVLLKDMCMSRALPPALHSPIWLLRPSASSSPVKAPPFLEEGDKADPMQGSPLWLIMNKTSPNPKRERNKQGFQRWQKVGPCTYDMCCLWQLHQGGSKSGRSPWHLTSSEVFTWLWKFLFVSTFLTTVDCKPLESRDHELFISRTESLAGNCTEQALSACC